MSGGRNGEAVALRSDFVAAARRALAALPRKQPARAQEQADTADDSEPNLDPYRSLGAWR